MVLTKDKARRIKNEIVPGRLSSPNAIRVVKLKPGTPDWPIRVKLKTIDYRTTKYAALSYAYETDGDGSQRGGSSIDGSVYSRSSAESNQAIMCDGNPVRVSKALWEALYQLQILQSDALIWIDRLCIDFENQEERATQVDVMSTIYAKASQVIVWLGKKNKGTDDTILTIRRLINAIDWRKLPRDFHSDFRDPSVYARFGMDNISIPQWGNIYIFCHAKWFTRLWTFYELASAKQAVFLVGDTFMDYDFLMDFAMILGLTGWLEGLSSMATNGYDEDTVGLTKMLGPAATLRSVPYWHPDNPDHAMWMKNEFGLNTEEERAWKFLELLLQSSERFECQDQRDKIFAPLAYVKRVCQGQPVNKTWPTIDYSSSVESVYSQFAGLILRNTHQPSILATAGYQPVQQPPERSPYRTRQPTTQRIPLD